MDPGEEGKKAMMFSFWFLSVIGWESGGRLAQYFELITKLGVRWVDDSLEYEYAKVLLQTSCSDAFCAT